MVVRNITYREERIEDVPKRSLGNPQPVAVLGTAGAGAEIICGALV